VSPRLAFGLVKTRHLELWGPFANRNMFALAAALVIPLAAMVAIRSRNYALWLVPAILVTGAVVSSGSRSGAAILLVEWCAMLYTIARREKKSWSLFPAAAVLAGATFFAVASPETLLGRLTLADFTETRLHFYRAAATSVAERPWLGAGGGAFAFQYAAHAPIDFGATVDHAHNDWVEWAVEGGVLLPIAMAVLMWKQLAASRDLLLSTSSSSLLIASVVDYPFHRPSWLLIAFGVLTIAAKAAGVRELASETSESRKSQSRPIRPMWSGEAETLPEAAHEFPCDAPASSSDMGVSRRDA
jgi:O-antigen ligase